MNTALEYWKECIAIAAEECDLALTEQQLTELAVSVHGGHENYGMAFYSPPDSDRYLAIDREWEEKYKALERKFDKYQDNAETAVKRALRQHDDANVSIGDYGEVLRHDGRTEVIQ